MNKEISKVVSRAKEHDADAFMQLVQPYTKKMYQTALSILVNDEDAADAIQETILNCWEKIHTLKESQYFYTWMTRILINNCYDICKKRARLRFRDMTLRREKNRVLSGLMFIPVMYQVMITGCNTVHLFIMELCVEKMDVVFMMTVRKLI